MENHINPIDSMDELKQEFQLLTRKIESQQIHNERLIHTVIKSKMKDVHHYLYLQLLVLLPFVVIGFGMMYSKEMLSGYMFLLTILFSLVSVIINFRINKVIGTNWLHEDLLASRMTLLRMKQMRSKELFYSSWVSLIWFGFLAYDFYIHLHDVVLIVSAFIGGVGGYAYEYHMYRKAQRINDELIGEIDRFKNGSVSC